ncbi:MAG TPA: gliding motility-associated C-terminal domain-containing protein [Bacteroidia bacterium]|nr:gliding motility-associated C-terminal domain-containing protein [Bacteroidia bacterium]
MRHILYKIFLGLILINLDSVAQLSPQVINSAGGDRPASNGVLLTDNVGEPFIQKVDASSGNFMITEGFLQEFNMGPMKLNILHQDVSCSFNKDGWIRAELSNVAPNYTVNFIWSDTTLCLKHKCSVRDSQSVDGLFKVHQVDSLPAMTVYLKVAVIRPVSGGTITDTIRSNAITIVDSKKPCKVTVFTGVTANNDGVNDYFYIKNIELFPSNRLTIYNRWGNRLFDRNGYDNYLVRWPDEGDLRTLTSGTYFYILELDDPEKTVMKGWIELLKN